MQQILALVKRLKDENADLEQKLKTVGQRLAQRERDRMRWRHDRTRMRSKVERILSEMETLAGRPTRSEERRVARSGKRGDA